MKNRSPCLLARPLADPCLEKRWPDLTIASACGAFVVTTRAGAPVDGVRLHFCNVMGYIVECSRFTVDAHSSLSTVCRRSANTAWLANAKFAAAFVASR